MKTRIFISRELNLEESDFLKILRAQLPGCEIVGKSLIEFTALPFSPPADTDGIFFYSGKGLQYFLQGLNQPLQYLENKFIGAFGKGTANKLMAAGIRVDFIGTGEAASTASELLKSQVGKTFLFVKAENSLDSLEPMLQDRLNYQALIVYRNQPKVVGALPPADVLVFTSPMNVESYAATNEFSGKLVVAIGSTTAKALCIYTDKVIVAEQPYEKEMAEAVLNALKSQT